MGRPKKEKPYKINKKEVLCRLVIVPEKEKNLFYMKEFSILKRLMEEFKNDKFWECVTFPKKYPSLAFLAGPLKSILRNKYNEFNYVIPCYEQFSIGEKVGEDYNKESKPQTVKDFLNAS